MSTAGGPAALRGYRLQTLYAAHLLVVERAVELRLEGDEDLDLLEGDSPRFVQVKGYAQALCLSDLIERREDAGLTGFLARASAALEEDPARQFTLASFGEIGPELGNAWHGPGPARDNVLRKLEGLGVANRDLLLQQVTIERCHEETMTGEVYERLQSTLAGGEPEASFELLFYWLHRQSELRATVDQAGLLERLSAAGRYLAERATHHSEWFVSVSPLETRSHDVERLREQFYLGMDARFEHISADVDVRRHSQLKRIREAFGRSSTVIVRGASGQGKSALAYRFARDYVASSMAFEVRDIRDLGRAQRISTALLGHARAIGVPVFVYLDAQPRDQGWIDVVSSLASADNIRVLVTVREEAWQLGQARVLRLDHEEMELTFGKDEASEVFEQLSAREQPPQFLSFEEAWRRFASDGPLLEFVYFVTRNERLRARLDEQIAHLREELVASELQFLRVAAVATAAGARLNAASLGEQLDVPDLQRLVSRLRDEYLLRAEDTAWLEALHPVRSTMMARILTDDSIEPWQRHAATALHHVSEADLEFFLLHSFEQDGASRDAVAEAVTKLAVASWLGYGGVLRALIWLDVRNHMEAHAKVLDAIRTLLGSGWWFVAGWDLCGLRERTGIDPAFEDFSFVDGGRRAAIKAIKRQRAEVERCDFLAAKRWLQSAADRQLTPPTDRLSWHMLAEVAFWADHWQIAEPTPHLQSVDLAGATALPLVEQADLVCVLTPLLGADDPGVEAVRREAVQQLRLRSQVFAIEENGATINAHFIPHESWMAPEQAAQDEPTGQANATIHEQKLACINLLADLYCNHDSFGTKGYGHRLALDLLGAVDESQSNVKKALFPPHRLIRVNQVFRGLHDLRHRPETWRQHAAAVLAARAKTAALLNSLVTAGWPISRANEHLNEDDWSNLQRCLSEPPLLPRSAVDRWGISSEGKATDSGAPKDEQYGLLEQSVGLWIHSEYRGTLRDVFQALGLFLDKARPSVWREPHSKATVRLAEEHIFDALEKAKALQSLFFERFSSHCGSSELAELDKTELEALRGCWALWHSLAYGPISRDRRQAARPLTEIAERERRVLKRLDRTLRNSSDASVTLRRLADGQPGDAPPLFVQADVQETLAFWDARPIALDAILRALRPRDHLDQRLLQQRWSAICIVPTVRGRALERRVWVLTPGQTILQIDPTKEQSTKRLLDIEDSAWPRSIEFWPSTPATLLVAELVVAARQLVLSLSRIADLEDIPDPDDPGRTILESELRTIGAGIGSALTAAGDRWGALVDYLKAAGPLPDDFTWAAEELRDALNGPTSPDANEHPLTAATAKTWLQDLKTHGLDALELVRLIVWREAIAESSVHDPALETDATEDSTQRH